MCVCVCVSVCLCVYVYHIFFTHSSVNGHLGCFHILAIVNSAAMNTGAHVSFRIRFLSFPDICPEMGLLDHMGALFSVVEGTSVPFSIVAAPVYMPSNRVGGFLLLLPLVLVDF